MKAYKYPDEDDLFYRYHQMRRPVIPTETSDHDKWIEQRLDHFNPLNMNTLRQRYFSRYGQLVYQLNINLELQSNLNLV